MYCAICLSTNCICAQQIAMADAFFAALAGERNLQPDFVRAAARDFTRSAEEVRAIRRMPLVGALAPDPEELAARSRDNCEA